MDGCTADDALAGFTHQMKERPAFLRQSMFASSYPPL